jgi:hypothetical protein
MPKFGILHDYDLQANCEQSAKEVTCVICGTPHIVFQWGDYSGEAMCTNCGCPYQLKWGSEKQKEEGRYPYLNLQKEFVPVAKEYWNAKHRFVCYGQMLGDRPGMKDLVSWLKEHRPYWMVSDEERMGMTEPVWMEAHFARTKI